MEKTVEIKVASNSSVKSVAGSIAKSIEAGNRVELSAIGAGAVNQAVKALAMSRGFLSSKGRDLYVAPGFATININGNDKTAIKFILKFL